MILTGLLFAKDDPVITDGAAKLSWILFLCTGALEFILFVDFHVHGEFTKRFMPIYRPAWFNIVSYVFSIMSVMWSYLIPVHPATLPSLLLLLVNIFHFWFATTLPSWRPSDEEPSQH
jgi:hypothetical protein